MAKTRPAVEREERGHVFHCISDVCCKCGMIREDFEDRGRPQCAARSPEVVRSISE